MNLLMRITSNRPSWGDTNRPIFQIDARLITTAESLWDDTHSPRGTGWSANNSALSEPGEPTEARVRAPHKPQKARPRLRYGRLACEPTEARVRAPHNRRKLARAFVVGDLLRRRQSQGRIDNVFSGVRIARARAAPDTSAKGRDIDLARIHRIGNYPVPPLEIESRNP